MNYNKDDLREALERAARVDFKGNIASMNKILAYELEQCAGVLNPTTPEDQINFLCNRIQSLRDAAKRKNEEHLAFAANLPVRYIDRPVLVPQKCLCQHKEPIHGFQLADKSLRYSRKYLEGFDGELTVEFFRVALMEAYQAGARSYSK